MRKERKGQGKRNDGLSCTGSTGRNSWSPTREPGASPPEHLQRAALSTLSLGRTQQPWPSVELVFKECDLLSLLPLEVDRETSGTEAAWSLPATS